MLRRAGRHECCSAELPTCLLVCCMLFAQLMLCLACAVCLLQGGEEIGLDGDGNAGLRWEGQGTSEF